MSRPSKATRQGAIRICALAASNQDLADDYDAVLSALGDHGMPGRFGRYSRDPRWRLAIQAWEECWWAERPDAEAEALLQCGWSPGERLVRR